MQIDTFILVVTSVRIYLSRKNHTTMSNRPKIKCSTARYYAAVVLQQDTCDACTQVTCIVLTIQVFVELPAYKIHITLHFFSSFTLKFNIAIYRSYIAS